MTASLYVTVNLLNAVIDVDRTLIASPLPSPFPHLSILVNSGFDPHQLTTTTTTTATRDRKKQTDFRESSPIYQAIMHKTSSVSTCIAHLNLASDDACVNMMEQPKRGWKKKPTFILFLFDE